MAEIIVDNSVTEITVTTDKSGPQGPQGDPGTPGADGVGISSIAKTATVGLVDTYTITYTDGNTSTFDVTNGADGAVESVNGQTGAVVLDADDVGALPDTTPIPANTSDLNNDSGFISAETDPVFGASAAAGIVASDITAWNGMYTKPSGGIPVSDLNSTARSRLVPTGGTTGQVLAKASGSNYDVEWVNQSGGGGAVDSVNGKTGTVVLTASDVGALPDNTTIDDVYWCTYGTTTSAQIETALTAGKIPMVKYGDYVYTFRYKSSTTNHRFICNYGGKEKSVACQSGTWTPNGDLTFLTTSYTPPVTSVNGQTGAVTLSIPTVPTNVSAFTNDAGYLTQHQSLTAYQTKAITDTGGYYTTDTVEAALQEIGAEIAGINTLIGTGVIS